MEDMKDFLAIARNDRNRERVEYSRKKYLVPDYYRMVRKIRIEREGRVYELGVQVSTQDYYFYIIENEENAYYSIREIYDLLRAMSEKEGKEYVCDLLTKQMKETNKEKFIYEDIEYEIRKSIVPDRIGDIQVWDGSKEISYEMLFMLINIVQEKSSAMFLKGVNNEKYVDGIIRLLIVLVCCSDNHDILNSKGWFWDDRNQYFIYRNVLSEEEKRHKKYYLTEGEFDDIMSVES